jgi:hypothetical protein
MNYHEKYLKYKNKYQMLKGGADSIWYSHRGEEKVSSDEESIDESKYEVPVHKGEYKNKIKHTKESLIAHNRGLSEPSIDKITTQVSKLSLTPMSIKELFDKGIDLVFPTDHVDVNGIDFAVKDNDGKIPLYFLLDYHGAQLVDYKINTIPEGNEIKLIGMVEEGLPQYSWPTTNRDLWNLLNYDWGDKNNISTSNILFDIGDAPGKITQTLGLLEDKHLSEHEQHLGMHRFYTRCIGVKDSAKTYLSGFKNIETLTNDSKDMLFSTSGSDTSLQALESDNAKKLGIYEVGKIRLFDKFPSVYREFDERPNNELNRLITQHIEQHGFIRLSEIYNFILNRLIYSLGTIGKPETKSDLFSINFILVACRGNI